MKKWILSALLALFTVIFSASAEQYNVIDLKSIKYRLLYESYQNGNWDIFIINADGTGKKNITGTKNIHEMYPKVSPDGKKFVCVIDTGEGRNRKRDLYLMNIDGSGKKMISDHGRQPCWSPDGRYIAFTKSESTRRFSMESWSTKGLFIYDTSTGEIREHSNKKLEHLYNLCWAPDGKYITATVLGGMGYRHTNIGIDVNGTRYFRLNVVGCRPEFSPDGNMIGWGRSDTEFHLAKINMNKTVPVSEKDKYSFLHVEKGYEVYHLDWSPDGKYIAFAFGPDGAQEVGGTAAGWNICIAEIATGKWQMITFDGNQNKEPDWIP